MAMVIWRVMKFFYDARFIRTDFHDGISRYSLSLLQALVKIQPVTAIICDRKQVDILPKEIDFVMVNKPSSVRELFIGRTLNHYEPDVVFSPMQTMGGGGRKYHLILTIHDLIYYQFKTPPSFLSLPLKLLWRLYHQTFFFERRILSQADIIATVSKTTKKLIKHYKLTRRPVRVIYNAPMPAKSSSPHKPVKLTKNIIWMGTFMPYKNVETLVSALYFLPEYQLHCLSPIKEKRKQELLALAPPNQVVFHNGVSDKQYTDLLANAHALASASKIEGFGLPIVEAMQQGTPVICSDISIFHEVAGKSALFFPPENQTEFAKQVVRLENEKIRSVLVKRGLEQAKKFNWENSAKELLRAIKEITE